MMATRSVVLLLAAAGCALEPFSSYAPPAGIDSGGSEGPDGGEATDTAAAPSSGVRPRVDSLSPADGTDEGGTRVTLKGSFSQDVVVTFDGKPADVVSVTSGVLVVEAPRNRDAGVVDVEVENAEGADVLLDGFRYWPDGTGLIGGIAEVGVLRFKGGYWIDASPVARASTVFLDPTEAVFERFFAPGLDQCFVIDLIGQTVSGAVSDQQVFGTGAPEVVWRSGGASIVLPPASYDPNIFAPDTITLASLSAGSLWSVELRDGFEFPNLTLADAVATDAPGVEVTQPAIGGTNPPTVGRSFQVSWSGTGASSGAFVELYHLTPDGVGGLLVAQYMSCWVDDDGSFVVPDQWARWIQTVDDYLELHVGRSAYRESALPHNNAVFLGVARTDAVGALFMR